MKSNYTLLSGVVFGIVALLQLVRAIAGWAVQIGPWSVPVAFSWIVVVVAGGLSIWAFRSRA
jgi:hypothetical protein